MLHACVYSRHTNSTRMKKQMDLVYREEQSRAKWLTAECSPRKAVRGHRLRARRLAVDRTFRPMAWRGQNEKAQTHTRTCARSHSHSHTQIQFRSPRRAQCGMLYIYPLTHDLLSVCAMSPTRPWAFCMPPSLNMVSTRLSSTASSRAKSGCSPGEAPAAC